MDVRQADLAIVLLAFMAQALKEVGVPSPGVTQGALVYAGVQMVNGNGLPGSAIIVATCAGALVGALAAYVVGGTGAVARLGRLAGITPARLERARERLGHRAVLAVTLGRSIPGMMTPLSLVAGLTGMSVAGFAAGVSLSTLAWAAGLAGLGALAGTQLEGSAIPTGMPMSVVAATAAGVVLLGGLAWRRWRLADAARGNQHNA